MKRRRHPSSPTLVVSSSPLPCKVFQRTAQAFGSVCAQWPNGWNPDASVPGKGNRGDGHRLSYRRCFVCRRTSTASSIIFQYPRPLLGSTLFQVNHGVCAGLEESVTNYEQWRESIRHVTRGQHANAHANADTQMFYVGLLWTRFRMFHFFGWAVCFQTHYVEEFDLFSGIHQWSCQPSPNEVAGEVCVLKFVTPE